ncbi:CocE/NonD family hydrolase [Oceanicola sp. 502str15]|uniref:CocE/NonD family hydrolase n=1 Tax=Oceanicola sp. 502str15 TaxID=2696061 RepID=UPI002094B738|nr:CocE/NonD family hydrolase [Oceanicola sp. 502str15]MCO6382683.1 CocE/NonD family hydrolase [Oceanicola sp. 502str15]
MLGTIEDCVVLKDVMVPMRDGVRLATDIVLPAREGRALAGPFPTLLHRTPYDKNGTRLSEVSAAEPTPKSNLEVAKVLARAGFAVMNQDCRGRYGSEGVFKKYIGEGEDGADSLEWARGQGWCNGRFGTFGLSYSAHVQTALALQEPEGLEAMFIDSGGFWNAYQGGVRRGGAFELKQATWALKHARLSPRASDPLVKAALEGEDVTEWFKAMPWRRGVSPVRHVPEYEEYLFEQWEHGTFDAFWALPELYAAPHYPRLSRVPVFLVCGWFDPYAETILEHFRGWRAHGGHAEAVIGPWLHGRRSVTHGGDVDFGPGSVIDGLLAEDYEALRVDWFRRWLLDAPVGARPPLAHWFAMGGGAGERDAEGRMGHGGAWRKDAAWPPEASREIALLLTAEGGLTMGSACPEGEMVLRTDPMDPVPSIGGAVTSGEPVMVGGAFDQVTSPAIFGARAPYLPLAARPDVLVFATPPLAEPVEIAGPVVLEIDLVTDVPDMDLTAKLIDWTPPSESDPKGFAMNLTDGILRLRYRDDWANPSLLDPGRRYDVRVELLPVAALFAKGHRIRLDISGSNFPKFDVNPQTGEPEGRARGSRIAHSTLFFGGDRPARLKMHRL